MDVQTTLRSDRMTVAARWRRVLTLLACPVSWDVLLPDLQITLLALP